MSADKRVSAKNPKNTNAMKKQQAPVVILTSPHVKNSQPSSPTHEPALNSALYREILTAWAQRNSAALNSEVLERTCIFIQTYLDRQPATTNSVAILFLYKYLSLCESLTETFDWDMRVNLVTLYRKLQKLTVATRVSIVSWCHAYHAAEKSFEDTPQNWEFIQIGAMLGIIRLARYERDTGKQLYAVYGNQLYCGYFLPQDVIIPIPNV